jgi:anionic cell wall polymer biosynthesis LytR-Cps2A-Psr (LCP) family protein
MKKTKGILFRFLALAVVSALCVGAFAARRGKSEGAIPQTDTARTSRDAATFLFLGTDRAVGLCDVIMLVRADYTDGALTVLQIPRDTYAAYTDKSYKKLNGA